MKREQVLNTKIGDVISSPGHHHHFCTDSECRDIIFHHADYIANKGLKAYIEREYLNHNGKNIIINVINDKCYAVDGNKHLTAIMVSGVCNACATLGELEQMCRGLIRIWFEGVEDGNDPYDVYIPMTVNTERFHSVRITTDYFKEGHPDTKVIYASTPFDSELFTEQDRGRPLSETYEKLRKRYEYSHVDGSHVFRAVSDFMCDSELEYQYYPDRKGFFFNISLDDYFIENMLCYINADSDRFYSATIKPEFEYSIDKKEAMCEFVCMINFEINMGARFEVDFTSGSVRYYHYVDCECGLKSSAVHRNLILAAQNIKRYARGFEEIAHGGSAMEAFALCDEKE